MSCSVLSASRTSDTPCTENNTDYTKQFIYGVLHHDLKGSVYLRRKKKYKNLTEIETVIMVGDYITLSG